MTFISAHSCFTQLFPSRLGLPHLSSHGSDLLCLASTSAATHTYLLELPTSSSSSPFGSVMVTGKVQIWCNVKLTETMDDDDINWNTEDELEIDNFTLLTASSSVIHPDKADQASSSNTKVFDQFIGMGFSKRMVIEAIEEHGEENTDAILETLLTYAALEPSQAQQLTNSDHFSPDYEGSFLDDFSYMNSSGDENGEFYCVFGLDTAFSDFWFEDCYCVFVPDTAFLDFWFEDCYCVF